jgi:hypothetical protein
MMKKNSASASSDRNSSPSFIGVFLNEGVTEVNYVYRGTSSAPDAKFTEGFTAKGCNTNLREHVQFWAKDSNYISTSLSKEATTSFIKKQGFIYEINPPKNGLRAENHLIDSLMDNSISSSKFSEFNAQREICVPEKIVPQDIKGAWQVEKYIDSSGMKGYEISSDFIPNPEYRPSTTVRLAQGAKVIGHATIAVGAGLDGFSLIQAYKSSEKAGNYQEFFNEGTRIIASWTAAATMGAAPAKACMIIGAGFGPATSLAGGLICGAVGSAIGYSGASHMINKSLKKDGIADPSKFQYQHENAQVEARFQVQTTACSQIFK